MLCCKNIDPSSGAAAPGFRRTESAEAAGFLRTEGAAEGRIIGAPADGRHVFSCAMCHVSCVMCYMFSQPSLVVANVQTTKDIVRE